MGGGLVIKKYIWVKHQNNYLFREEDLDAARLDIKSEEQFPKVVMAPNAAEYYEKLELEKAIAESQRTASLAGMLIFTHCYLSLFIF